MEADEYNARDRQYLKDSKETGIRPVYEAAYRAELHRLLDHVREVRSLAKDYGNGDAELLEAAFHVVRRLWGRMMAKEQ